MAEDKALTTLLGACEGAWALMLRLLKILLHSDRGTLDYRSFQHVRVPTALFATSRLALLIVVCLIVPPRTTCKSFPSGCI